MSSRIPQFIIFLFSGLVLGGITYFSLMWSVWGAPVHPAHYIALLGSLALVIGAVLCLKMPVAGRRICVASLLTMGFFWIPGVVSLVPQHNRHVSPFSYLAFLLYLTALGVSLLFPTRSKWSLPTLGVCIGIGAAFGISTTVRYIKDGEYNRPSFTFFRWHPGTNSMILDEHSAQWINSETKALLQSAGITGELDWTGTSGSNTASHQVIVLAQREPTNNFQLHYPREGILIYAFDGTNWFKIPKDAPTYPAYALLQPSNGTTMLVQTLANGAQQGRSAFHW